MKKFTPILLALASIAVLSFKQSNSSEKSDAALSKNDIEILEIIQNKRKLRNSNENQHIAKKYYNQLKISKISV